MRSIKITLLTLLLLGGGFALYLWLGQTPGGGRGPRNEGQTEVPPPPGGQGYRQGKDVWVVHYDRRTGKPTYRFRADTYTPQSDGRVDVENPRAEFFMSDGNVIRLTGDSGQIAMRDMPKSSGARPVAAPTEPPRRGELKTVLIEFLPSPARDARPVFWVTVDNTAFDMDAFEIRTESAVIDGETVAADQIPVTARGEYEFDGSGLVIRWNQRDEKLSLLEIAHGKRMLIRHPGTAGRRTLKGPFGGAGLKPAVAGPAGPAGATSTQAGRASAPDKDLYRATFERNVRILQGERQVVNAREMVVDLLMSQPARSSTRSATTPTTPTSASAPTTSTTAAATTTPATRPDEEPITILWEGKLAVVPGVADRFSPTEPGSAVVRFIGDPVEVAQDRGRITCGMVMYSTADARLTLLSTDDEPLRMTDAHGANVQAQTMDFVLPERRATLRGEGRASFQSRAADGQAPETIETSWNKSCTLWMKDSKSSPDPATVELSIDRASLAGDVVVRHPRLDMRSGSLDLAFGDATPLRSVTQPSTRPARLDPQLRRLVASGNVRAVVHEEGKPDQSIESESLTLATAADPAGKLYFSSLDASGAVLLADAGRQLRAGKLSVTMLPATQPAGLAVAAAASQPALPLAGGARIESIVAQDKVIITTADKQSAWADQLKVETVDGEQRITLLGQPARVADADTTVSGPIIDIFPQSQRSRITGGGTLKNTRAAERPIDLTWDTSADIDLKKNQIEIIGNSRVVSKDDDGTTNTVKSKRLVVELADADAAKDGTDAAKKPAGEGVAILARKSARMIRFLDDARLESVRNLPNGQVDRGLAVRGPEIQYELSTRQFRVPAAGMMAIETAAANAGVNNPAGDPQMNGATTFRWSDGMVFDEPGKKIVISGNVAMVHSPDAAAKEKTIKLDCQTLTAHLIAAPNGKRLDLERIVADGPIRFTGATSEITAATVEYDPVKHLLACRGGDRQPVEMFGKDGTSTGSFGSLVFDTRTNHIVSSTNINVRVPR